MHSNIGKVTPTVDVEAVESRACLLLLLANFGNCSFPTPVANAGKGSGLASGVTEVVLDVRRFLLDVCGDTVFEVFIRDGG